MLALHGAQFEASAEEMTAHYVLRSGPKGHVIIAAAQTCYLVLSIFPLITG